MVETVTTTAKMAGFATPEVQVMFDDWVVEVEKEILNLIKEKGQITPSAIAEELIISEDSVFGTLKIERWRCGRFFGLAHAAKPILRL